MSAGERLSAAQATAREARHADVIRLCDEALAAPADELDAGTRSELAFLRADSMWHLGRWTEAAEGFRAICALEGDDPELRARVGRAWRLLGEMARRSHAFGEATEAGLRAIGVAGELGDDVGLLFGRVALARIYSDVGRGDEAEPLLRGILRDSGARLPAASPGRALVEVAARTALGLLLFRRQRLAEALDILVAGACEAARVTHGITLAAWHRQLAIVYEVQQDYSAAVYHLDVALDLYERAGYEPGRYDVYWSLSLSYTHLGDLSTARLCLEQTQDVATRLGMQLELGKTKSSFAELALREGDYRAAIGLYRQDILIGRELGDQQALGHCNRKLAECHRIMGELVPAERHAGASVRNFEAMRRLSEASQVRVLLGRILVEAGRLDEAEACLAQCREQLGPESRPSYRSEILRLEALLAEARREPERAVAAFEAGLALQDHRSPTRDLATTHLEAGRAYRALGDSDSALRHFAVAADLAGMVGSRDLWEQGLTTLREMDVMAAQQLMLKPYLPGRAVEELAGGDRAPRLAEATMMFVDMRGATALSGSLSPLELAKVVDAFLGPVTRILFRWQGTVDKFIGDCVVAVFGLGSESATAGAAEAVEAGLEIIEYMEATRQIRRRAGASVLEASIGVNTGEVAAGCFGPLLRRDYTVLGYHVNLAQRLQGVAGALPGLLGTRMVLAGTTLARLDHPPAVEPVDLHGMALKGIDTGQLEAWLVQPAAALR